MSDNHLITPADINYYWMTANRFANRFFVRKSRKKALDKKHTSHYAKHHSVHESSTMFKIISLLLIPLFLAAAVSEGGLVGPLFESAMFGDIVASSWLRRLISYLAAGILMGISLATGYCAHNITIKKDIDNPFRRQISKGWIVGGLLLCNLYLGMLYLLMWAGKTWVPALDNFLTIVPAMGICELVLGLFAAKGFVVLYVLLRSYWLEKSIQINTARVGKLAEKSHEAYRFYLQLLQRYNTQSDRRMNIEMNAKIKAAIHFDQSYAERDQDSSPREEKLSSWQEYEDQHQ